MKNTDIREAVNTADLKLWQIAEALNLSDGTFSRKLRKELPQDVKNKIFEIIEKAKAGEKNAE